MTPTVSIRSLHLEYRLWINELNFYRDEIRVFERHLEPLISKNNGNGVPQKVEHFQNQFILQKEAIDNLRHDLHTSERQLASFVHDVSGLGLESIKMDNHSVLRERIITFRKIHKEIKTDFRRFEAEWM